MQFKCAKCQALSGIDSEVEIIEYGTLLKCEHCQAKNRVSIQETNKIPRVRHDKTTDELKQLGISKRTYNALARAGIRTVDQAIDLIQGSLQVRIPTVKGLGEYAYSDLTDKLTVKGYNLSKAFIVGDLIKERELVIIHGAVELGASYLAIDLMTKLACGMPYLGHTPTRPLQVLYASNKNVISQINAACNGLNPTQQKLAESNILLLEEIYHLVNPNHLLYIQDLPDTVSQANRKIDLIVLDSFESALDGYDLDDVSIVKTAITNFKAICKAMNCIGLLVVQSNHKTLLNQADLVIGCGLGTYNRVIRLFNKNVKPKNFEFVLTRDEHNKESYVTWV